MENLWGEAKRAVTLSPPNADVVVLVRQMELSPEVGLGVGCLTGVPVKASDSSWTT